jgi:hypothetical protein
MAARGIGMGEKDSRNLKAHRQNQKTETEKDG